jgi:hypothetical protein
LKRLEGIAQERFGRSILFLTMVKSGILKSKSVNASQQPKG